MATPSLSLTARPIHHERQAERLIPGAQGFDQGAGGAAGDLRVVRLLHQMCEGRQRLQHWQPSNPRAGHSSGTGLPVF